MKAMDKKDEKWSNWCGPTERERWRGGGREKEERKDEFCLRLDTPIHDQTRLKTHASKAQQARKKWNKL